MGAGGHRGCPGHGLRGKGGVMVIGIPKEIMLREGRVAAIPETVIDLRRAGHTVLVEVGAGILAGIADTQYQSSGAELTTASSIWERSDIIMKVKEPLFNDDLNVHEADLVREGKCLVTFLHPANHPELVLKFEKRLVTTISMDCIPRVEEARSMDALSSMSMIAGYKAIVLAADNLPRMMGTQVTAEVTLQGARVLLVGFGVVGKQAFETARRLGAEVVVLDARADAQRLAAEMGAGVVKLDIPAESAAAGASAKRLPPQLEERVRDAISAELPKCDIVVLSALVFGERAPILLTRDMVGLMKYGSVIVDVSVDQGGNCEVVVPNKIVVQDGVTIVGVLNLPGSLPVHSTQLYARNIANFVLHLTRGGKLCMDDAIVRAATITHNGQVWHEGALRSLKGEPSLV